MVAFFNESVCGPQTFSVTSVTEGDSTAFRFDRKFVDEFWFLAADLLRCFTRIRFEGPFAIPSNTSELVFRTFGLDEFREDFTREFERRLTNFVPARNPSSRRVRVSYRGLDRKGLLMQISKVWGDANVGMLWTQMSTQPFPSEEFGGFDFSSRQPKHSCAMRSWVEVPFEQFEALADVKEQLQEIVGGAFQFEEMAGTIFRRQVAV